MPDGYQFTASPGKGIINRRKCVTAQPVEVSKFVFTQPRPKRKNDPVIDGPPRHTREQPVKILYRKRRITSLNALPVELLIKGSPVEQGLAIREIFYLKPLRVGLTAFILRKDGDPFANQQRIATRYADTVTAPGAGFKGLSIAKTSAQAEQQDDKGLHRSRRYIAVI